MAADVIIGLLKPLEADNRSTGTSTLFPTFLVSHYPPHRLIPHSAATPICFQGFAPGFYHAPLSVTS